VARRTSEKRWTTEQIRNAQIIAQVGRSLGASDRDILIALMTGFQESGLRNLNYGDRDSIGIFQQRNAWGSRAARLDPAQSARMFFLGGRGGQRGLLDFRQRNDWELWRAAQKVQVSAFPRAYAKWEGSARGLLSQLGGRYSAPVSNAKLGNQLDEIDQNRFDWVKNFWTQPQSEPADTAGLISAMDKLLDDGIDEEIDTPGIESVKAPGTEALDSQALETPQFEVPELGDIQQFMKSQGTQGGRASGVRSQVINIAKSFIGRPYVFGAAGPSAFDCSGLLQYAFRQAGVNIPRLAYQQARNGQQTSINSLRPGDMVFWGNSRRTQGNHIALWLGDGLILEAPRPGLSVRIRRLGKGDYDDKAIGIRLDY